MKIKIYFWPNFFFFFVRSIFSENTDLFLSPKKNFKFVFSENIDLFFIFRKKEFWWLIANFEIKEELKHVKTLKNILSKHTNMADINYEQDIIKSNTYYQTSCNEQLNMSIKKKKNKHKNETKYLLAWAYPSMKEYFRN